MHEREGDISTKQEQMSVKKKNRNKEEIKHRDR